MPAASSPRIDRLVFLLLCVTLYLSYSLAVVRAPSLPDRLVQGLGAAPGLLLLFVVVGRITLWFGEKLYLFLRNVIAREPKLRFERNLWQDLSLSLVIGTPSGLWLQSW